MYQLKCFYIKGGNKMVGKLKVFLLLKTMARLARKYCR